MGGTADGDREGAGGGRHRRRSDRTQPRIGASEANEAIHASAAHETNETNAADETSEDRDSSAANDPKDSRASSGGPSRVIVGTIAPPVPVADPLERVERALHELRRHLAGADAAAATSASTSPTASSSANRSSTETRSDTPNGPSVGDGKHSQTALPAPARIGEPGTLGPDGRSPDPRVPVTGPVTSTERPGSDLSPTAADRLLRSLELVAVAAQALDAIEMHLLVEAEDVNAAVRRRGHRLRRWWANQTGVCRPEASERVRVAGRLAEWFPILFDALQRGEISFAHAARLVRAATPEVLEGLKDLQPHLIRLAATGTFEQFERDLRLIVDRLNPDGTPPDESRVNQLRVTNEFGNTRISGLFDPVSGEIVANALKHGVDAIRREHEQSLAADPGNAANGPDAGPGPATSPAATAAANQVSTRTAQNKSDLADSTDPPDGAPVIDPPAHSACDAAASQGPSRAQTPGAVPGPAQGPSRSADQSPAPGSPKSTAQPVSLSGSTPTASTTFDMPVEPSHRIGALQADSLVRICQTALSAGPLAGSLPTAHIDVIVHSDDQTLAVTRNNNGAVAADMLNDLGCNGIFRTIELSETGAPLRMGRARRLATADQRRAVFARDGGCAFPGCGAPARECDVHHVHHWSHGGPTDVENLATLCRFHHSITHTNGWAMTSHAAAANEPHHFQWTTPTGATLRSEHRQPGAAARSIQQLPPEPPPTPPAPNL